ncbi:50S ribosomal protein L19 [Candidatus Beckwithbacteria bacterium CG23_combo_of_CG06-09_8_20_14_all_34_8]|uniref:50S ribosomal protein L19 n=1 Tax=Candidatus Beckwithbacteria bacterium CG23_combo_of_CG06-09_8_20_14_all_34_8 TaxID=1974497 RepID=A0A2H0B792_9BACT|nr:MAG: 50S ribosomal protein L19 [Candidatus Beckwithbacteria bacterium CG23_combo_of_CG06-09_8_20_14_all_34_8]
MALYLNYNDIKFQVGDTIRVKQSIIEGGKKRSQTFEGLVMKIRGQKGEKTFTVRKISKGIGVERIWMIDSPAIEEVKVMTKGKVKRADLSYLRERTGRLALKVKRDYGTNDSNGKNASK